MPLQEAFTGFKILSNGATEWSLVQNASYVTTANSSVDGIYQVWIDVSDLVANDELLIRIYEKIANSNTQQIAYESDLMGPQSGNTWISPSLLLMHAWDVTANVKSAATINVAWSIRQVQ